MRAAKPRSSERRRAATVVERLCACGCETWIPVWLEWDGERHPLASNDPANPRRYASRACLMRVSRRKRAKRASR